MDSDFDQQAADHRERLRLLYEERKHYVEASRESSRSFDKVLLAIASGGVGVSLVLLERGNQTINAWLYGAWIVLAVSLLSNLTSFMLANRRLELDVDYVDLNIRRSQARTEAEEAELASQIDKCEFAISSRARVIGFTNWLSLITLGIGLVLLGIFATIGGHNG